MSGFEGSFARTSNAGFLASIGQATSQREVAVSAEMAAYREKLRHIATVSTVGIQTLSCVSFKNAALVELAGDVTGLPSADEQISGIDQLLVESNKLWPDQNAYVIAKLVGQLIDPQARGLHDRAGSRVGQHLLRASLKVAPDLVSESLVSDSMPLDVMKGQATILLQEPQFGLSAGARGQLEEAGLLEPVAETLYRSWDDTPQCLANWIRSQICEIVQRQITGEDLQTLLEHAESLPADLRARSLAMIMNTLWNSLQDKSCESHVLQALRMVDQLPITLRLTSLEAFHNQLAILPSDAARAYHPLVSASLHRLTDTHDFRFNRSRRDLVASLEQQGDELDTADLGQGESLAHHKAHGYRPKHAAKSTFSFAV